VRAIGLDLGTKRVGVALSDSAGTLALPYEVLQRCGDRARDHAKVAAIVQEVGAERVVVGLPLSLDGSIGPAAEAALAEVEELRAAIPVPIETQDERLTTVTAIQRLGVAGVRGGAQRRVVDKVAASVLLQAWLDRRAAEDRDD
jgi:putative Holliday junction resolvase